MPTQAEWAEISRRLAKRPNVPPQISGPDTRKFHQALRLDGSHLREIQIWEKNDQKFEQFATPWELKRSSLAKVKGPQALIPVVDNNGMVVGYSGVVKDHEMFIGRANVMVYVSTLEEVLKYHRMYVGPKSLHAEPHISEYGQGFWYYAVLTDIFGEITSIERSSATMDGQAENTPLPGLGWLRVLQAGFRALISLRNGFRTLGRQPPTPPPAPRALPPGQPQPPSGPLTNPGNVKPGNVKPGTQTIGGETSIPQAARVKPRAEIEREIERARLELLAAAPKPQTQPGLLESINIARRQLGLPPLSSAKSISELHYRARNMRAYKEIDEWLDANPNASWAEKVEVMDRMYKRWRVSGLPGDH